MYEEVADQPTVLGLLVQSLHRCGIVLGHKKEIENEQGDRRDGRGGASSPGMRY